MDTGGRRQIVELGWIRTSKENCSAARTFRTRVRFRLGALGMSARVTDGWSLRALRKLLRVSPARLRYFIGNGMLRVRDPRISASSLAVLCDKIRTSLDSSAIERIAAALATGDDAYSWDRAANLLGVPVARVQAWISAGQLRVEDTFVTDRSFEEFCKKHGDEINMTLIDPSTAKWLVREYGVTETAKNRGTVSPSRKHALVSQNMPVRKADSRQPILSACPGVPIRRRCGSRRSIRCAGVQQSNSYKRSVVQVNKRVSFSAPVLKRRVRLRHC